MPSSTLPTGMERTFLPKAGCFINFAGIKPRKRTGLKSGFKILSYVLTVLWIFLPGKRAGQLRQGDG